jgi:hypothetical protein
VARGALSAALRAHHVHGCCAGGGGGGGGRGGEWAGGGLRGVLLLPWEVCSSSTATGAGSTCVVCWRFNSQLPGRCSAKASCCDGTCSHSSNSSSTCLVRLIGEWQPRVRTAAHNAV